MLRSLRFVLRVETTNTSLQQGMLLNRSEEPTSAIVSLHAGPLERFDRALNEQVQLTRDEVNQPGFIGSSLSLESVLKTRDGRIAAETRRTYNTQKRFFTVGEVVKVVEKFERIHRPKTSWIGDIDCHHVFFEGLRSNAERSAFRVCWGS
jgi:hypothetical protein